MFDVNVTDLDFWIQIDPVKQPIAEQLCGIVKLVSVVRLRPLIIILITASLSSKTYKIDTSTRMRCI